MVTFAIVTAAATPLRKLFEIHAAGCRDLKALASPSTFEVNAEAAVAARDQAIELLKADGAEVKDDDFYVQACCQPARLRAAGRVWDPAPVNAESEADAPLTVAELPEDLDEVYFEPTEPVAVEAATEENAEEGDEAEA